MARSRSAKKRSRERREKRQQQAFAQAPQSIQQPAKVSRRVLTVREPEPMPSGLSALRFGRRIAAPSPKPAARRQSGPLKGITDLQPISAKPERRKAEPKRVDPSSALAGVWRRAQAKLQAFSRRADPDKAEKLDRPSCGPRPNYGGKGNGAASIAQAVKPKKDYVPWC